MMHTQYNRMVLAVEGMEDVDFSYTPDTLETIEALIPRVKDEVLGMAEEFNLEVSRCRVTYIDGMEHYRTTLTGTRGDLEGYLENTDGFEEDAA